MSDPSAVARLLAGRSRADQDRFLAAVQLINSTSTEFAYHFCMYAPPALPQLAAEDWQERVLEVMGQYDRELRELPGHGRSPGAQCWFGTWWVPLACALACYPDQGRALRCFICSRPCVSMSVSSGSCPAGPAHATPAPPVTFGARAVVSYRPGLVGSSCPSWAAVWNICPGSSPARPRRHRRTIRGRSGPRKWPRSRPAACPRGVPRFRRPWRNAARLVCRGVRRHCSGALRGTLRSGRSPRLEAGSGRWGCASMDSLFAAPIELAELPQSVVQDPGEISEVTWSLPDTADTRRRAPGAPTGPST